MHGPTEPIKFLHQPQGREHHGLVEMLMPDYALAQQVKPDDPRIKTEMVTFESPRGNGPTKGLLARPAGAGKRGAVVVVHENRGLNPYIADVARRLAVAGFTALAPDGLSSLGGYPGDDEKGREMQAKLDSGKLLMDFIAAFEHLKTDPDYSGKVGAVGFCFGGSVVNSMAVMLPDLAAAVPYYGSAPKTEDVPRIKAPLLIHHGELDKRLVEGLPVGLQLLGDAGDEASVIAGLAAVERVGARPLPDPEGFVPAEAALG
jgi:carboxymethylenebutenolidase